MTGQVVRPPAIDESAMAWDGSGGGGAVSDGEALDRIAKMVEGEISPRRGEARIEAVRRLLLSSGRRVRRIAPEFFGE